MKLTSTRGRNGRPAPEVDRLPPHDEEAEQGVLGCCLLGGGEAVRMCLERFGSVEVFYDLRHQVIFGALVRLFTAGKGIDVVLLVGVLRDGNELDGVGGAPYLSALEDVVPSAANLPYYLERVWEKFLARQLVARTTRIASEVYERNGISEGGVARVERELEEWRALASRGSGITPQDLKRPGEFGDGVFGLFFRRKAEEEGWEIPFAFPWRVRRHELTIVSGEDGSGKSMFLLQMAVCLMRQGLKGCIASLEVPSEKTLWMMMRQLLGIGPHVAATEENERRLAGAVAWLNARMWMYDYVGITDWRLLLDVFRYGREKEGVDFFVVDSVMRIGIAEDDLATQSLAAAEFAGFTVQTGAHLFLVQHQNKSKDGHLKSRITASKRWTDNANNITEMRRNEKKGEKVTELEERKRTGQIDEAKFQEEMGRLRGDWDAKFVLGKQRYPGTVQNGSKHLWFDRECLQFRDRLEDAPVDYLL
jgi:KaiC/GvpD/RAD55 family RecA-like ATPase